MLPLLQITSALVALAHVTSAARLDIHKRDSALEVTLDTVENGVVKATVKNTGNDDLNLLKFGSLFDSAPVQKLNVYAAGSY